MSFPASPSNGQLVVVNNITYQFDSTKQAWVRVLTGADFLTVNNLSVLTSLTGNISGGNVYATGYFFANGQPFTTSNYGNSNVASYLTGNITTGNVSATGYYFANGAPFSSSNYGDSNVAAYIAGNVTIGNIAVNNITATGNIWGGGTRNFVGNTVPVNPGIGDTWYETDTDTLLRYVNDGDSNQWVDITGVIVGNEGNSYSRLTVDTFVGDGTTTSFPLSATPFSADTTLVNYNGVFVSRSSYTIGSNIITFGSAPAAGAVIEVTTFEIVLISNVVTNAAGTTSQVQFNSANLFAGSDYFTFDTASNTMSVTNVAATGYYWANGEPFVSSVYGDSNVAAYIAPTVAAINANVTAANASIITANSQMKSYVDSQVIASGGYSNVAMTSYLATNNITVANITGGGVKTTSTSTPPTNPSVGDIWYSTGEDRIYRYTSDGTTKAWLDITGAEYTFDMTGEMSITGNIIPSANVTYSIGTSAYRFKDLYLSGNTIYLGNTALSESTINASSTDARYKATMMGWVFGS